MEGQTGETFFGEADELAGGFVFGEEDGAPNYIGDPGTAVRKGMDSIVFK